MRRISGNFDAAAYRQQMRSPESAPVPGYAPDAALYATQTPVAVLEPPVLAPQPIGHVDFVPAPPSPTDTQVPATSVWTAPHNPVTPTPAYEAPQEDPNAFRPINPRNPFDVDRSYQILAERYAKQERKEVRKARREAWIGRNATRATTVLFAASSVVALATSLGLVHNNLNSPSTATATELAAPDKAFTNPYDISTELETDETTTTTSSTTPTTTKPTTPTQTPPTTEAPAPTAPPETVTPTGVFERDFGQRIGSLQIPALCLNAEVVVYNADEATNGTVGTGNAVVDQLIQDPAPVDDCATVNERVAPETITRAERVRNPIGHVNKYVPIMGFERLANGDYRHAYPCTTGTPENPVNTALPGHGSTYSAANADAEAIRPGDTAVFTRDDGIECTYVAIDTEVVPFQGDDSHIIGYRNPNYSATLVTYGCSDMNGNTGSADGRRVIHWGLVGSEINPQISQ